MVIARPNENVAPDVVSIFCGLGNKCVTLACTANGRHMANRSSIMAFVFFIIMMLYVFILYNIGRCAVHSCMWLCGTLSHIINCRNLVIKFNMCNVISLIVVNVNGGWLKRLSHAASVVVLESS